MATFKPPGPKIERCERTDLWPDQCACKDHRNITLDPEIYDGILIERFLMSARYDGVCVLDGTHKIIAGTPIALVAEETDQFRWTTLGYCCDVCRRELEKR